MDTGRRAVCPTVLQMEAVECGAAALAMVLAYHGRVVPLAELRAACGVSRDGSKASNLLKAARKYGLVARGFKYESPRLRSLPHPAILFWSLNHFVVLEGFGRGGRTAFIQDPAEGPRSIGQEELETCYSGVVLTFEPGPEFQRGGQGPSLLAALHRRLRGSEAALLFVLLCGLALVIPGLVLPAFSRAFVDEVLVGRRDSILRPLLLGLLATAVVRMVLTWLQEVYLLRLQTQLALETSSRFLDHVLKLPIAYFAQRYAGEIGSRVAINDKVARLVSGRLATTLLDCVLVVFYALLMLFYDVPLTLAVVAIALLNVAALRLSSRLRADAARRLTQDQGKLVGTAMGGLAMVETLKATGGEDELFSRWAGYQAKALSARQSLSLAGELVAAVPTLVDALTTVTVLLVGGLEVMNGRLSVGMLVAYQSLAASFTRPLQSLVTFGSAVEELEADLGRLDDVLSHRQDPLCQTADSPPSGATFPVKLAGAVELRNVTFGYSPLERPLIEGFNLSIRPGQRVALVGASGSGKSTVSKLVAGLYEPWEGQVLLDGKERRELPRALVASSVALVDQDVVLFEGTVRDNLTLWDGTLPMPAVVQAARDACIAEAVEAREGTYGASVLEGGGNWSGGQRQRLEIARALALGPTVLILDEATSALDPTTEARVDDALRRRGCTCLIVAHRLSTVRDADEIVVLSKGRIVQRGTHDEMKDAEGPYADLIAGR